MNAEERAALVTKYKGQSGPIRGWEEHVVAQENDKGRREVRVTTTRPATVAALLESDRVILAVLERGESITVVIDGTEYKAGGILKALRRRRTLTDDQRAELGERLRTTRRRQDDEDEDDDDEDDATDLAPPDFKTPGTMRPLIAPTISALNATVNDLLPAYLLNITQGTKL